MATTLCKQKKKERKKTEAKEVWRREDESKGDIRTSRCMPTSVFK